MMWTVAAQVVLTRFAVWFVSTDVGELRLRR